MKRSPSWQRTRTLIFPSIFLVGILLTGCGQWFRTASTGSIVPHGDVQGSLVVGGLTRTYTLYIPPAYDGVKSMALVLSLHGAGGDGASQMRLTHMNDVADANSFLVVYPDGIDHHWNDGRNIPEADQNDVGFLSTLIDHLVASYRVDETRVYATGISNGAMMTQRLGCELANKLAAIAPVAGLMPAPEAVACHPVSPMPVLQFEGTADPYIPFRGGRPHCDPGFSTCGLVLSTAQTMSLWSVNDRCQQTLQPIALPDPVHNDGPLPGHDSTVQQVEAVQCAGGASVILDEIEGGGHTWPGGLQYLPAIVVGWTNRDIDASQVEWNFFSAYQRTNQTRSV